MARNATEAYDALANEATRLLDELARALTDHHPEGTIRWGHVGDLGSNVRNLEAALSCLRGEIR